MSLNREFVAIDWGSTNFRAYRISTNGEVLDQLATQNGASVIDRSKYVEILDDLAERWPESAQRIIACGMVGSSIGWQEVPYVSCPASASSIAGAIEEFRIGNHTLSIVPGTKCESVFGQPDVMRGEETQLLGLLASREPGNPFSGIICMPGTHSKWSRIEDGQLTTFSTSMTGDIFAALMKSGLLKGHLQSSVQPGSSFDEGVLYGAKGGSLARMLFSVRSRVVTGALANDAAASFASGVLIGNEVSEAIQAYAKAGSDSLVTLVGEQSLCELYSVALALLNTESELVSNHQATLTGIGVLSNQIGASL